MQNVIECANMFYHKNFLVIGGVETYIYEIARKYGDYDIVVVYDRGDINQIRRLRNYVRVIKNTGQKIKCKKAFFNYHTDIIDNVDAEEYIQIIHAMFKTNNVKAVIHPKIDKFFCVSKTAGVEWEELTGIEAPCIKTPLTLLQKEKECSLFLISATRLTREKGKQRIIKLANMLDERGINYLWLIFTNDTNVIDNPNIVYMKPRLDIRPIIASISGLGYGVQLSDCEGDCYFTRECEALGVPVLVTPVPSFKEQGLVDGKNCYFLPFDMNDIDIDKIVNNIPKYTPYIKKDTFKKLLAESENRYKEDLKTNVTVRCVKTYFDIALDRRVRKEETFETTLAHAHYLTEAGVCEVLEDEKSK